MAMVRGGHSGTVGATEWRLPIDAEQTERRQVKWTQAARLGSRRRRGSWSGDGIRVGWLWGLSVGLGFCVKLTNVNWDPKFIFTNWSLHNFAILISLPPPPTIWFTGTTKKSHAYLTLTDALIILDHEDPSRLSAFHSHHHILDKSPHALP